MAESKKCNLSRLAYSIYEHPSLEAFDKFATAFGFETAGRVDDTIFYNGYGTSPYIYVARASPSGAQKRFIGAGFTACSAEDFEIACQMEGAELRDVSDRPGGGKLVAIKDLNGYEIQIVWGQEKRTLPSVATISSVTDGLPPVNGALEKHRKGTYIRMQEGPARIHKLGHFGYITDQYEDTIEWYTSRFNFKLTDLLWKPEDETVDVASFFHLDLGEEFVDHHCLLITRGDRPGTTVHHSSFEVEDLDTQHMGHQWLLKHKYELVWGIGRHVHGSQIFDYWYDPSHFIIEHYADGDIVNVNTPVTKAAAGQMAIWGPPVPAIWGGKKEVVG